MVTFFGNEMEGREEFRRENEHWYGEKRLNAFKEVTALRVNN
jgi:hypothetical protein